MRGYLPWKEPTEDVAGSPHRDMRPIIRDLRLTASARNQRHDCIDCRERFRPRSLFPISPISQFGRSTFLLIGVEHAYELQHDFIAKLKRAELDRDQGHGSIEEPNDVEEPAPDFFCNEHRAMLDQGRSSVVRTKGGVALGVVLFKCFS